MFSSLPGGTPKPEPEQVIRNYTEELKTAPDEVGAQEPGCLFGNKGQLQTKRPPTWSVLEGHLRCLHHALGTWG